MSVLGGMYDRVYGALCGVHPNIRPWHFHWLGVKHLYADLRMVLPRLRGRVLDVGCRDKPYARWLTSATEHFGIDVHPGPKVDLVIAPGQQWQLESSSFDAVVCTQVLQYVADLEPFVSEMFRVLKPGGTIVVTVPFAYNQHTALGDYWRFSVTAMERVIGTYGDVVDVRREGGIGSTTALLFLNWIDMTLNTHRPTRWMKPFILPGWIALCGNVNAFASLLDRADSTRSFYGNVVIVGAKRA
jgi:SAM-dependent methyltransferase